MPLQDARRLYLSDSVATASAPRLLVLLYERLVRDLVDAERSIGEHDIEGTNKALIHAQDILVELRSSLDKSQWGPATRLDAIYVFLLERLVKANITKDASIVRSCRRLVEPLCDAWREAAVIVGSQTVATPAGA